MVLAESWLSQFEHRWLKKRFCLRQFINISLLLQSVYFDELSMLFEIGAGSLGDK